MLKFDNMCGGGINKVIPYLSGHKFHTLSFKYCDFSDVDIQKFVFLIEQQLQNFKETEQVVTLKFM